MHKFGRPFCHVGAYSNHRGNRAVPWLACAILHKCQPMICRQLEGAGTRGKHVRLWVLKGFATTLGGKAAKSTAELVKNDYKCSAVVTEAKRVNDALTLARNAPSSELLPTEVGTFAGQSVCTPNCNVVMLRGGRITHGDADSMPTVTTQTPENQRTARSSTCCASTEMQIIYSTVLKVPARRSRVLDTGWLPSRLTSLCK